MPDSGGTLQLAEFLASKVVASREAFSRVFEAEAVRFRLDAPPLHALIQVARLTGEGGDGASNLFAFRIAFKHAASEGWLNRLVQVVTLAGMFGGGDASAAVAGKVAELTELTETAGFEFNPEAVIDAEAGFPDIMVVVRAVELAARRVCQILIDRGDTARGTGFLVGAQSVLTNWHVVRMLFKDGKPVSDFKKRLLIQFDNVNRGGVEPHQYRVSGIEPWDEAYSAEYEDIAFDSDAVWTSAEEKLDFALIKLEDAIGNDRGWYQLAAEDWPKQRAGIHLVQFPGQHNMRLTSGTIKDLVGAPNSRRIRHTANAANGSSGGLCLGYDISTGQLSAKALHQGAIRNAATGTVLNQGIPLAKILPKISNFITLSDGFVRLSRLSKRCGPEFAGAPVFGRVAFQRYVAEARAGLVRIIGVRTKQVIPADEPLVGRGFSEKLLLSLLPADEHQIVKLSPTEIPSQANKLAELILSHVEAPGERATSLPDLEASGQSEAEWIATLLRQHFGPRLLAAARGRFIWLVINDLHRFDIPDASGRRFLDALYQGIASIQPLRVVLIGLKNHLASIDQNILCIDEITANPGLAEVQDWLNWRFGPQRNVGADVVEGLAKIAFSLVADEERSIAALAATMRDHFDRNLPSDPSATS